MLSRAVCLTARGIAFAITLLVALPALALDLPDNVRREIEGARDRCIAHGGSHAAIELAVREVDIDGNGIKDFIVDTRKLACTGTAPPFCDKECSLHVFLAQPGRPRKWSPLAHVMVLGYELSRVRGHPALILIQSDDYCAPRRSVCRNPIVFGPEWRKPRR